MLSCTQTHPSSSDDATILSPFPSLSLSPSCPYHPRRCVALFTLTLTLPLPPPSSPSLSPAPSCPYHVSISLAIAITLMSLSHHITLTLTGQFAFSSPSLHPVATCWAPHTLFHPHQPMPLCTRHERDRRFLVLLSSLSLMCNSWMAPSSICSNAAWVRTSRRQSITSTWILGHSQRFMYILQCTRHCNHEDKKPQSILSGMMGAKKISHQNLC